MVQEHHLLKHGFGLVTMASKLSSFTAFATETVSWGISLPIFD